MSLPFHRTRQLDLPSRPSAIALSSDAKTVVAACKPFLCVMETKRGSSPRKWTLEHPVGELSLCPQQHSVAATTGTASVAIYDLRSGEMLSMLTKDQAPGSFEDAPTTHVGFSPDGTMLVGTTDGNRICVFNVNTGLWDHIMFVKYSGCAVSVSPTGTHVVLFGKQKPAELSGHITMFRVRRGLEPLWTQWHESDEAVTCATFSADGRQLITCGAGDGVRRWNVDTGKPMPWRPPRAEGKLLCAWAIQDGEHVATVGEEFRVYQVDQAAPVFETTLPVATRVAPAADGRTVAIGHDDPTLSLWTMAEAPT